MSDFELEIDAELNIDNAQIEEEQPWKKRSIYKLPPLISKLNEKAYQPQVVSFGPYHHGEPRLKPMEDHKERALLHFLRRSSDSLHKIFNSMVKVAQELMDSYDCLDLKWKKNTEQFVRLMIMDGCFMLEIMQASSLESQSDYSSNDPIVSPHGKLYAVPFIKEDMLLLENQLPMLVLFKRKGFKWHSERDAETLNKQILRFYGHDERVPEMGKCLHILDVYRKSLLYKKPKAIKPTKQQKDIHGLRSATELNEAGIRFKRSKSESLCDISFHRGVLSLPTFIVDDATNSTFLNLIAFERCHVGAGHDVTLFICFMDNIVKRDISLLSSKGIILNLVGTDEAAADLFNTMSKDLVLDPSSDINVVHERIISYCKKPWHKWRAMLIHNYFRSPWAIISVVAAIILFALATVSTVYDVIGK